MKIALYHNLPSGGARRAVCEIVKRLAQRGHTLDEFCPTTADLGFLPLAPFVRQTFSYPFQPRGIYPHRLPFFTPYFTWVRLMGDWLALARLNQDIARDIEAGGYQWLFSHDCQLMLTPTILKDVALPTLHYCHHKAGSSKSPPIDPAGSFLQKLKHVYYALPVRAYPYWVNRQEGVHLGYASYLYTNSCFSKGSIKAKYGVDAGVCYLGVDGERFCPMAVERQPFVLNVGAIHAGKGQHFLVEAIGKVPAHSRPPLVIAANSWDVLEYQALQQFAAQKEVKLTVRQVMNDEEMVRLYNQATLMVYASPAEPWGLAVVEAMACGVPVLAIAAGGAQESIVDGMTGVLVPPQPEIFAQMLLALYQNKSWRLALGKQAADHVRQCYSWERTVNELEQQFVNG